MGAAVGFYFGYRWNREKIKAEAFKESEEEIDKDSRTVSAEDGYCAASLGSKRWSRKGIFKAVDTSKPPVPVRLSSLCPTLLPYEPTCNRIRMKDGIIQQNLQYEI